jgi:hypothetical protein
MVKRDITPTDAPTSALVPISPHSYTCPYLWCQLCSCYKQNYARGRVNHVAVEESQEAPDVIVGMFLINDIFAIVLFDSEA